MAARSFDDVTLTSDGLKVAGAPATAKVHITGLPVNGGKVGFATASFSIGQAAFKNIPQLRNVGASRRSSATAPSRPC